MTFIVRASIDEKGQLHGLVLHVYTGRKERFMGVAQLGEQITTMTAACGAVTSGLARLEDSLPGPTGCDEGSRAFNLLHNVRR